MMKDRTQIYIEVDPNVVKYLKLRTRFLSMCLGGLDNSRRKCGKLNGTWTQEDELEYQKLKSRKREIESVLTILLGLDNRYGLEHFIEKEQKSIDDIIEHRKQEKVKNDKKIN